MDNRELFERCYAQEIADGEISWDELHDEEKESVCERCGVLVNPEMPFDEGDPILCGGNVCKSMNVG